MSLNCYFHSCGKPVEITRAQDPPSGLFGCWDDPRLSPVAFYIRVRVTAPTGVSASVQTCLRRGWILAERTQCSKGKLYDPMPGSHRRFTSFPQATHHHVTKGLINL